MNFSYRSQNDETIRKYFNPKWYPESLYLLAMVDYLSRENDIPLCRDYDDIRIHKLAEPLFPLRWLWLTASQGVMSGRPRASATQFRNSCASTSWKAIFGISSDYLYWKGRDQKVSATKKRACKISSVDPPYFL